MGEMPELVTAMIQFDRALEPIHTVALHRGVSEQQCPLPIHPAHSSKRQACGSPVMLGWTLMPRWCRVQ